jgi:hypothetical protein
VIDVSAEPAAEASIDVAADASAELAASVSADDASAEEVRDEELLDEDESAVDELLRSSEVEFPEFRRRRAGLKTFATIVGSTAALVVASVAWSQFASRGKPPAARVAERAPERRAPDRAPEARSPAPPVTNEAVSTPAPTLEGAVGTSLEKAVTTVAVTIKTVPEEAVIFRARQRLGSGVVEVNVERNAKQRFTALLDGYTPSNFTLDGSRDSITIRLRRAPKRPAAPAPESDSPYGEPNVDSNAATAPAATAAPAPTVAPAPTAPAPESTTPAAPSPDVSSPASPE